MGVCFGEFSIEELLGDSLTLGLMRADGVDPDALRNMLRDVASSLSHRTSFAHRSSPEGNRLMARRAEPIAELSLV